MIRSTELPRRFIRAAVRTAATAVLFVATAARAQAFGAPDIALLQSLGGLGRELMETAQSVPSVQGSSSALTRDDAYRIVAAKLAGSSVPDDFIRKAIYDPATQELEEVAREYQPPTGPPHNQTYDEYRRIFMTKDRIQAGVDFYLAHRDLMAEVERRTGVDPLLPVSLAGVETFYGKHSGRFPVLGALYTIVVRVPSRSAWAARELAEFLKIAHAKGFEPHSLRGSYAGAFGYYQFEPSTYNGYAVDFDGDGQSRWDDWPDVMGSIANYLVRNGYQPGGDFSQGSKNWWAIYAYNHSEFYVRVVLELRQAVQDGLPKPGT